MNRKLKSFLALSVYSFSEGGKAWPEALKTSPGHLARSPAKMKLPFCYVNDSPNCLFGASSVSFSRSKRRKRSPFQLRHDKFKRGRCIYIPWISYGSRLLRGHVVSPQTQPIPHFNVPTCDLHASYSFLLV